MVTLNGRKIIHESLTDLLNYSGDLTFVLKAKCHCCHTGNWHRQDHKQFAHFIAFARSSSKQRVKLFIVQGMATHPLANNVIYVYIYIYILHNFTSNVNT